MPNHHKGPPAETRALDAFVKLSRALHSVGAELGKSFAASGLTEGQFGVLEALYHRGPMNQRELGRKLLCSNANICTVLDNLEKAGFVARERDTEDRRVMNVSLSPAGRRLIQKIFPEHAALVGRLMNGLTDREQEQLAALCKKLGTSIKGDGP